MTAAFQRVWVPRLDELQVLTASLALLPRDDFLGDTPLAPVNAALQREGAPGAWNAVDARPAVTPSGLLVFFRLEHRRDAAGAAPVPYRVAVSSKPYRPAYRETKDFEDALVTPYDDRKSPPPSPAPMRMVLYPAPSYPFPPDVPVLRGRIRDGAGAPVPDALVTQALLERVLSDERGEYALPLRWVAPHVATAVSATDRLGRTGTRNAVIPADLGQSFDITVT